MTESEFNVLAEQIFARIETAIEASGADIECEMQQGILELEFDDGSKIIINRHTPNRELWIAARSGGFHFGCKQGQWLNTRNGEEFFATLKRVLEEQAGEPVALMLQAED